MLSKDDAYIDRTDRERAEGIDEAIRQYDRQCLIDERAALHALYPPRRQVQATPITPPTTANARLQPGVQTTPHPERKAA